MTEAQSIANQVRDKSNGKAYVCSKEETTDATLYIVGGKPDAFQPLSRASITYGNRTATIEPLSMGAIVVLPHDIIKVELDPKDGLIYFPVGIDRLGNAVGYDLTVTNNLLVSATSGWGKSTAIHSFIYYTLKGLLNGSITTPLHFIGIDPKIVTFSGYKNLPNFDYYNTASEAVEVLKGLLERTTERLQSFEVVGVENIAEYNVKNPTEPLPYLVVIIDELADVMAEDKHVEKYLIRLTQKARAVGIHFILATQTPLASVIPSTIKNNIPARLSYLQDTAALSVTALGHAGAEKLTRKGDFITAFTGPLKYGRSELIRPTTIKSLVSEATPILQALERPITTSNAQESEANYETVVEKETPQRLTITSTVNEFNILVTALANNKTDKLNKSIIKALLQADGIGIGKTKAATLFGQLVTANIVDASRNGATFFPVNQVMVNNYLDHYIDQTDISDHQGSYEAVL